MDYPVAGGVKYRQGILAMEEYLKKIELEQRFFAALSPEYVYHVLRSQPEDYTEQFYNICSIVWKDLLLKMVLREKGEEFRNIQSYIQRHTKPEVIEILRKTLHIFITEKYDCNLELESYLSLWIADYVAEMFQ